MSDSNQRPRHGITVPWRPRKVRRLLAGVALGATLAGGGIIAAGRAHADIPPNCAQQLWWRGEALRFVTRTICDGPIHADGSWQRGRNFHGDAYYVPVTCSWSSYGGSCSGGYWRPEYDSGNEIYVVTPDTVLPDEPGHLPVGGPVA